MIYKAELIVDGATTDITDDIKNWDDITVSLKRNDYGGVVRTYSDKFEFVRRAYEIIRKEYRDKFLLNPKAILVLYTQNKYLSFDERFRCNLDFASLVDDGITISMNALDNSLEAIIKANKSQIYDIYVSSLGLSKKLVYDRIDFANNIKYYPYDSNELGNVYDFGDDGSSVAFEYIVMPVVYSDPEFIKGAEDMGEYDNVMSAIPHCNFPSMFKALANMTVHVELNFKVEIIGGNAEEIDIYVQAIVKDDPQPTKREVYVGTITKSNPAIINKSLSIMVNSNESVQIAFRKINRDTSVDFVTTVLRVTNFKNIILYFYSKGNPILVDVIKPLSLLKSLLNNITSQDIECSIDAADNSRLANCYLIAAESIRGLEKAKIHTSFSKFSEWMEAVFGYVYRIADNRIEFLHRDKLYHNFVTKSINNNSINNFSLSIDNKLLFSGIKIGYDKQDYDSVNGRDEFRFTNSYSTGNTLTDNVKELISPYRADAYGIEYLALKRDEDTTDDKSDNDVFFIGALYGIYGTPSAAFEAYLPWREGWTIEGVVSPSTMFNVMYSPRSMLKSNISILCTCTYVIGFTASEGNSDIRINGVSEKDAIIIPYGDDEERLFMPYKVEVETSDIELSADHDALISITHEDEEYQGYISDIDTRFTKEEACKYSLMVKHIF